MKKIICIISIIALLVLNYDATVFAETTENPSNTTAETTPYHDYVIGELKDGYKLCYNTIPGPPWMEAFYVQYDKYVFVNFLCEGEKGHGFFVVKGDEKLMLSEAFDKGITDIEEVVDIITDKDITSSNPVCVVDTEKVEGNWKDLFMGYHFSQDDNSTEPTTEGFDVNNLPEILADGNRMYPEVCDGKEVYYCRYSSNSNGTIKIWSGGAMETFRRIYDENLNLLISNNDLEENVLKNEEGCGGLSFEVEAGKTYVIAVGMYETCDVPEKICFWVDFSTSYLPTESTETLTDNPAETATTEPTEPPTDKPTEPVTTEPTEPTTDKLTEPATTESVVINPQPTEKKTTTQAVIKPAVTKKANTIKVTAIAKTVKAKKLNSKKQSVKLLTVTKAQGKFTVTLVKSETSKKIRKKVTVSKKGVFTLNRGKYTKGTYKIKVKIFAKGNSKYKSKTINKTVTIKIK